MKKIILAMISSIVILTLLSSLLYVTTPSISIKKEEVHVETPVFTPIMTNVSKRSISMKVPAVDSEGNGVTATLKATLIPGEGRALANINQILFWVDTQHSIRTALRVAENVTGINMKDYDVVYSIETNASVIEGPSAGAALTILTIAALENKTLNSSVMITGTINHDGSIGPVGQIIPKAEAAKNNNVTLFLVPVGQGVQTTYKEVKHCEKYGFVEFCTTELKPEKVSIGEKVGIEVKEVSNIREALKYFLID
jgi:uncharacterized protein